MERDERRGVAVLYQSKLGEKMESYKVQYCIEYEKGKEKCYSMYVQALNIVQAFCTACTKIEETHQIQLYELKFYIHCICREEPVEYLFN